MNAPGWLAAIVAFAALVTALGVLWNRIVKPIWSFVAEMLELVDMLPWLRALRDKEKPP